MAKNPPKKPASAPPAKKPAAQKPGQKKRPSPRRGSAGADVKKALRKSARRTKRTFIVKTARAAIKLRWMRGILYAFAVLGVMGIFVFAGIAFYYTRDLPDHNQLAEYNPAVTSRLYAGDGKLLEEYAKEKRIFVPISAIPKALINAFIAAEDQNFYRHPGIDFFSILRAAGQNINNIISGKKGLIGASTITQQVAKNILLSNEKTITRKIKEAILAFRMTMAFSKDRILELYLNEIYLGAGSYGVAAAALNYFNKSIDELNIEEAAMLAALPKAPSTHDPRRNYKKARDRRDWVIRRMLDEGYIDETSAGNAMASPIRLSTRDKAEVAHADFFAEEVRRNLVVNYGQDILYGGGLTVKTTLDPELQKMADKALRDGLISYDRRHGWHGRISRISLEENWVESLNKVVPPAGTEDWELAVALQPGENTVEIGLISGDTGFISLDDMKWARKTENGRWEKTKDILEEGDVIAVEKLSEGKKSYGLRQVPKVNGAIVAMDPHTGRVLAMSGGFTYRDSQFNRATQAWRQPGSAFKPFVYLTALENGFTPATLLNDEPIEFETVKSRKVIKRPIASDESPLSEMEKIKRQAEENLAGMEEEILEEVEVWAPQNYTGDFYGPTTLRVGLEKSRNVMTVHLGLALGMEKIMEIARRFGIYETPRRNMSTVLGATETTLMKLITAYGILVNGGKNIEPSLIERIQDRNGKTIFRRDDRICEGCFFNEETPLAEIALPVINDNREQVTDPRSAYQMVSMLEGAVRRGTGVRARKIGKPVAGKTGTTNNSMDTWFVGFSPDLVVGVYAGFDKPKPMGDKETGSSTALPIFVDFMQAALKNKPAIPFRIPPGIKHVKIDAETGFLPADNLPHDQIILEAFKAGTEPKIALKRSELLPVIDEPINPAEEGWVNDPKARNLPITRGTGGIY